MKRVKKNLCSIVLLASSVFTVGVIWRENLVAAQVDSSEIIVGSSLPLRTEGLLIQQGIDTFFRKVNEEGGIRGKRLRLLVLDDKKSISQTIKNIKHLLTKTDLIVNVFTTGAIGKLPAKVTKRKFLILGLDENTASVQQAHLKYLVHTKPSLRKELEALVTYAVDVKKRERIAIFYVNDATGIEARDHIRALLKKRGLKPVAEAFHPRRAVEVERAASKIARSYANVVLCFSRRHATYHFVIQAINKGLTRAIFLGTSYLYPIQKRLKSARGSGVKFITTSVVPSPATSDLPIVQEYRQDWKRYYKGSPYSAIALLAYINAAIFVELARAIPGKITADAMISQAERLKSYRFKGLTLHFDPETRSLLHNLWLSFGLKKKWIDLSEIKNAKKNNQGKRAIV